MSVSVNVMAHPSRRAFVDELLAELGDVPVVWDRKGDRWDTGRRALLAHLDYGATHALIVQDDAILCRDLVAGVERAVKVSGQHPLGLYVGAGRLSHRRTEIGRAIAIARRQRATWVAMGGPWWGVAIVIPVDHIPDLVAWCDREDVPNYDRRIARYYLHRRIKCWYAMPSLVDHRPVGENPSLVPGRTGNRHAHHFIGAEVSALEIDWDERAIDPDRHRHTPRYPKRKRSGGQRTMSARKIAERRIYGFNRHGRRVLIAAKGQPIPPSYDEPTQDPEPARGEARPTRTSSQPEVDLSMKRNRLDEIAAAVGVENPASLPNKQAVLDAIRDKA